jgi:hypothetical protein
MTASVRPLSVSYGSAAHDEYDHGRHHAKLTYYPMAFKEGGRHTVRQDREPDHGNCHADHTNSIGNIHGSSPAIAASRCTRLRIERIVLLQSTAIAATIPWTYSLPPLCFPENNPNGLSVELATSPTVDNWHCNSKARFRGWVIQRHTAVSTSSLLFGQSRLLRGELAASL